MEFEYTRYKLEATRRIQSYADKSGKNQEFKARAQRV